MNLNSLKSQYLAPKAQIVLMDEQCRLLDSCHTLFRLDKQAPTALSEQFPILESIENLFKELNDNEELFFPRVETNIDTNIYISDFTFFKNPADKYQIVWIIQDLTQQYLYFSSIQRERNELYIRNRRLEFQQEINTLQTELRYRQQIHQLQAEQMIHLSPLSENCLFNFTNTLWTPYIPSLSPNTKLPRSNSKLIKISHLFYGAINMDCVRYFTIYSLLYYVIPNILNYTWKCALSNI